jgi:hypothetical protein
MEFQSKWFRFHLREDLRRFQAKFSRDRNERRAAEIKKRIFVLPSGVAFIESSLLSGETINLNPLRV